MPTIVILGIFILGTFFAWDFQEFFKGISSSNWQTVDGTILSRDTKLINVGTSTVLDMQCKYQYRYQGVIYIGDTIRFQQHPVFNGNVVAAFEKKYSVGDKVKVYFDKNDPKDSCLEPGASFFEPLSHLIIYIILALIIYFSAYPKIAITRQESRAIN